MGISTWCLLFLKGMWELTLVLTSRYTALMIIFFCRHWKRRGGSHGRDRMVVGFTTTYAISAYHHWCEFKSRSDRGVQHYVIKIVSDLRQVGSFLRVLQFPPIKLTARYNWNIVESGVKQHQTNKTGRWAVGVRSSQCDTFGPTSGGIYTFFPHRKEHVSEWLPTQQFFSYIMARIG
jgi:hypothetical protein